MPAKFEDSTHQLWHCETSDGSMVLKLCNQQSVDQSSFWVGLNQLFGIDFPKQLGTSKSTANYLNRHGAFVVPEVIAAKDNHFVLTRFLAGEDLDATRVTADHVVQLAQHIGRLHQQRFSAWGDLHQPTFAPSAWGQRLRETLRLLADNSAIDIPEDLLAQVLAIDYHETAFVPIMPDLRWDQLRLSTDSNQIALIDLDAFVIGPRSLELVLLEYLLSSEQFVLFKSTYMRLNDWPDYHAQKTAYQLLLFLMNVLGETDLASWIQGVEF